RTTPRQTVFSSPTNRGGWTFSGSPYRARNDTGGQDWPPVLFFQLMPTLSAGAVKTWYNRHYAAKGLQTKPPQPAYPVLQDSLGALEHFLDMGQGLEEMKRVAKPGARFCIMVPNQDFIGWKVLGHQGTAQQDINEHLQSLAAWRRLFEAHGLGVVRASPDRW